MSASYAAPGPDDPIALSAREKRILADIEDQLWSCDPEFGQRMTAGPRAGRGGSWTAHGYRAAVAAVLLLLVVTAVLPPYWRAILGLVLTLGVLPCLLLWACERSTSR